MKCCQLRDPNSLLLTVKNQTASLNKADKLKSSPQD